MRFLCLASLNKRINKPLTVYDQTLITGEKMSRNIHRQKPRQRTAKVSFNDRYLALEESCKLTGLSFDEFFSVMKAFTKCSEGHMAFFRGDITLCFEACGNEIILNFEVENKKTTKTVQHRFNYSEIKMLYTKYVKTNC
jgi:hypothetical protein